MNVEIKKKNSKCPHDHLLEEFLSISKGMSLKCLCQTPLQPCNIGSLHVTFKHAFMWMRGGGQLCHLMILINLHMEVCPKIGSLVVFLDFKAPHHFKMINKWDSSHIFSTNPI